MVQLLIIIQLYTSRLTCFALPEAAVTCNNIKTQCKAAGGAEMAVDKTFKCTSARCWTRGMYPQDLLNNDHKNINNEHLLSISLRYDQNWSFM